MTTNQYDTIIIGAGQSDLTPNPSPAGRGESLLQKQCPRFSTRACSGYFDFRSFTICLPISFTLFFGSHFRRSRV